MNEFDSLMQDADAELFSAFGSTAVLNEPDVKNHDVSAVVDRDVEQVFEDRVAVLDYVVTLKDAPSGDKSGWRLQIGLKTYTLRQLLDRDGLVERWQATLLAAG